LKQWVDKADIVMVTLDTLRYDVAQQAWREGQLPGLEPFLPKSGWERRHTPASFTYAAHHAFMAGFLPTPSQPGPHPRLFASAFAGSQSTAEETFTFAEATLPEALANRGYATICVGGTGFFSMQNDLSRVLPGLFQEAYWRPEMGVTHRHSEVHQVKQCLLAVRDRAKVFVLLNVAALHQPNWFYGSADDGRDNLESHRAALIAVDRALQQLWSELRRRGPAFVMIFSDHGTAYGEDGYHGHRLGHEIVWTVPYTEFLLS
jgi:arylsulfatase A-like enzyme